MRTILVTGGTTFVSRYVSEYFIARGDTVYTLHRGTRPSPEGAIPIIADRLALGDRLRELHLDAVLDVTAYTAAHVNALLDALPDFGDYILVSSSAVYPETNPQPFTEEQPCGENHVWGAYGANKLAAERALLSRVPNAYVLRPPYLYGEGENLYRAPFVFDCALSDRPFFLPRSGEMTLQFFHVEDLCRMMERLLAVRPTQRIFNVGNPELVTIREWVRLCYAAAGKTPRFVSVGGAYNQRDYFPFYDYEYALDVQKQASLLPATLPLAEGLRRQFRHYVAENPPVNKKPYQRFIDAHLPDIDGAAR